MRILVVSNFFPPRCYGGYEIGCSQVVDFLCKNHQVYVLTCGEDDRGNDVADCGPNQTIDATLWDDFDYGITKAKSPLKRFWRTVAHENHNRTVFADAVKSFGPDIVYFWNLAHTSASLPAIANRIGIPTACFVFDHSWCEDSIDPWSRFQSSRSTVKSVVRGCANLGWRMKGLQEASVKQPQFAHVPTAFLHDLILDSGFDAKHILKVGWGVDLQFFSPPRDSNVGDQLRFLFVGQVSHHKGVHVLVDAFCEIAGANAEARLTVAGKALSSDYMQRIKGVVTAGGLDDRVEFLDFVEREQLPALYRAHDVLVFPSIWEEPMGIVPMEAMACGLAVLSSGRGGSKELIDNGVDGILFDADSPGDLGRKMMSLLHSKSELSRLRLAARRKAEEEFDFAAVTKTIESDLEAWCERRRLQEKGTED